MRAVRAMFDAIAPRYDLVNRVMTFGLDRGWRRATVAALALRRGSRVLDLACGTGDLCRELARAGHHPVGADLSSGMLAHARASAPLCQADATALGLRDAGVDGAVSGFALRNFAYLPAVFAELARVVRAGGRIALLEVSTPSNPLLRAGHAVYFGKVVPLVGGALSDRSAYSYLPRSVAYLPPPARLLEMLGEAGFASPQRRTLCGGSAQLLTATRSPAGR